MNLTACIFFTPFPKTISLFLRRFFQKIRSLCMACIQERLLIKSGLWWRENGISSCNFLPFIQSMETPEPKVYFLEPWHHYIRFLQFSKCQKDGNAFHLGLQIWLRMSITSASINTLSTLDIHHGVKFKTNWIYPRTTKITLERIR